MLAGVCRVWLWRGNLVGLMGRHFSGRGGSGGRLGSVRRRLSRPCRGLFGQLGGRGFGRRSHWLSSRMG